MVKHILKLNIKVLIGIVLVVGIGSCLFSYGQGSITKTHAELSSGVISPSTTLLTMATRTTRISNDSNWAGYIAASDLKNPQANVTSVSASWTVPTVTNLSQNTFSLCGSV